MHAPLICIVSDGSIIENYGVHLGVKYLTTKDRTTLPLFYISYTETFAMIFRHFIVSDEFFFGTFFLRKKESMNSSVATKTADLFLKMNLLHR